MSLSASRLSLDQVEIGSQFDTRCDAAGLLPVVVMDRVTCNVLILCFLRRICLKISKGNWGPRRSSQVRGGPRRP